MSRTPFQFLVVTEARQDAAPEQVRKALETLVDSGLAYAGEAAERGRDEMNPTTSRIALEANFHAPQPHDTAQAGSPGRTSMAFMIQIDVPEDMAQSGEAGHALNALINCGLIDAQLRTRAFCEAPEALARLALDIDLYPPSPLEQAPAPCDPQPDF